MAARQHGRPIYYLTANFHRAEEGFDHQDAMPEVPAPEQGVDLLSQMASRGDGEGPKLAREWGAVEARSIGTSGHGLADDPLHPARAQLWFRMAAALPDDPHLHLAAFTWASDMSLLGATLAAHDRPRGCRWPRWTTRCGSTGPSGPTSGRLYDQWSPSAHGARGLAIGRVFTRDGLLVATVAQEVLIRRPAADPG